MSFDGTLLKIHEMGEGRPLLLLHGLFSNAHINWIKYGQAEILVNAGFKLIMPDLRAHGQSAAPQDVQSYPQDVIVKDIEALIAHYDWHDYDLCGFSLGARSASKLLIEGAKPNHAILCGMGWEGMIGWGGRLDFFLEVIENYHSSKRGDTYFMAVQFMKTTGIDPIAAGHLLRSFGSLDSGILCEIDIPMMVICGDKDQDNGSGELLAQNLKNAHFREIKGNHMMSVMDKDLANNIVEFLYAG